jgi:phage terminase large subunit GpA-like protein
MGAITDALIIALKAAARAMRPKELLTVSEWADANRILAVEGSAEPGPWKTSRTPYLREIMDQLSEDSPTRLVAFMKSSQVGGTEVGSNWIGYIMVHAKGPVAVIMPTEKSLGDWMSQKFDPMAAATPAVADVLRGRSNKSSDNNAQRKKFIGGILYTKTAGSTAELKSTSLRYALADEVDEYDWSTLQGDPLGLIEVRLTTFHDRKLFVPSSPTMKDASRIEELFEKGDKRRYHVPCPHCHETQALKWSNVRWAKNPASPRLVRHAWYVCEHCGVEIQEHEKTAMLAKGRWIADAPNAPYPSYHINAIYSPLGLGLTWAELATEWIDAQDDPAKLMRFMNTRLGETWADRSRDIKPNVLEARAEPYELRTIPVGCLVLTAGVDTQDDRLEIHITGHGRGERTWPIDYHILPGNPADESLWEKLAEYLNATFANSAGKEMRIEATAIDSGGHYTHHVYAFVRSRRVRRCIAIKGANTPGRHILGKPSAQDVNWKGATYKKGVALYTVGTDTAKHMLYARLSGDAEKDPAERKVHFSQQLDASYYDQLVSETFNPRTNKWEKKKGKRNETLDTWVYSIAASHHPELYLHKWKSADWARREAMLEPRIIQDNPEDEASAPAGPATELGVSAKPKKVPQQRRPGGFTSNW